MVYIIVVLAISTGARKSEIAKLRWNDIDFERGMIILEKTKNKERRSLTLFGHALDLMKDYASKNYTKEPLAKSPSLKATVFSRSAVF